MRLFASFGRLHGRASALARERTGFTMVELLTVTAIMGTLARMSVPDVHKAALKAEATGVVNDIQAVRTAVVSYRADHGAWPADQYAGRVPDGLAPYLPQGFRFVGQGYLLDWENWSLPSGLPRYPQTRVLLGVSIVTSDRALGEEVVKLLGSGMAHYTLGDRYTFVIERR